MKKITFILVLLFTVCATFSYSQSTGANSTKLEIDKITNCKLRYYYYPNLQAYFDLQKKVFFYKNNGKWYVSDKLPKNYGGYSLYKMNHVIITDYDEDEPFKQLDIHKKIFPYNFKGAKM